MPQKKHKKRRLGEAVNGVPRLQATGRNSIWAMDFVFDVTADGRSLKWLAIVDEFTRENLALEVSRQFKAADVIDVPRELIAIRGTPAHLGATTARSSSPMRSSTGWRPRRSALCTSSPAARGRMATPRASTAACGTNSWRWRSSRRSGRPEKTNELGENGAKFRCIWSLLPCTTVKVKSRHRRLHLLTSLPTTTIAFRWLSEELAIGASPRHEALHRTRITGTSRNVPRQHLLIP